MVLKRSVNKISALYWGWNHAKHVIVTHWFQLLHSESDKIFIIGIFHVQIQFLEIIIEELVVDVADTYV